MKKTILSLAFVCSGVFMFAQSSVEDIVADKNIDWAVEYIQNFRLSIDECQTQNEVEAYSWNYVNDVKFVYPESNNGFYTNYSCIWIADQLLKDISSGVVEVYNEPQLINRMDKDETLNRISRIDTVVTFDPETYEETVQIVRNTITSDDVKGIQARIIYYHNKKTNTFGTLMLAYAPLVQTYVDVKGEKREYSPICWVKAQPGAKSSSDKLLQSGDICWIVQTRSGNNVISLETTATVSPGNNQIKVLKNQRDLRDIVLQEVKSPSKKVYNAEMNPILPQDIADNLTSVDTVITFDPETYEKKVSIVRMNREEAIKSVRFIFNWYYDFRRKNFYCRPVLWGPNLHVTDTEGQFRYYYAFFYQKME